MAEFVIHRARRENTAAFIALAGPTGSGKTKSALELATGLAAGGKILLADTEGRRALHYSPAPGQETDEDCYEFDHVIWHPPYTPEANAELIDLAEKNGYAVLIIDSESDEMEGEGGLQEIAKATNDEFWAKTKARHKHALINRIRRATVHIIFCLRCEERVRISKVEGKIVIEPLGWAPICEKRFMHEMQSSFMFHPDNPGFPIPVKRYNMHTQFFPHDKPITRAAGAALAVWNKGGAPVDPEFQDYRAQGFDAAKGGMKPYAEWFEKIGPRGRVKVGADLHAEMKTAAETSDTNRQEFADRQHQASRAAALGTHAYLSWWKAAGDFWRMRLAETHENNKSIAAEADKRLAGTTSGIAADVIDATPTETLTLRLAAASTIPEIDGIEDEWREPMSQMSHEDRLAAQAAIDRRRVELEVVK